MAEGCFWLTGAVWLKNWCQISFLNNSANINTVCIFTSLAHFDRRTCEWRHAAEEQPQDFDILDEVSSSQNLSSKTHSLVEQKNTYETVSWAGREGRNKRGNCGQQCMVRDSLLYSGSGRIRPIKLVGWGVSFRNSSILGTSFCLIFEIEHKK